MVHDHLKLFANIHNSSVNIPSLRGTGRLWSDQGLSTAMPHSVVEMPHGVDILILSFISEQAPAKVCLAFLHTQLTEATQVTLLCGTHLLAVAGPWDSLPACLE